MKRRQAISPWNSSALPAARQSESGRPARTGVSAIELVTAASVLGTLLLFLVPALSRLQQAEAFSTRKAFALHEVRNIVEQLQTMNTPVLPELSRRVRDFLPDAHTELTSQTEPDDNTAMSMNRHTVVLFWKESSGERSVQLSWWTPESTREEQ